MRWMRRVESVRARRGLWLGVAAFVVTGGGLYRSPAQQSPGFPSTSQSGIPQATGSRFPEPDPNAARQQRATEKFGVEDRQRRIAADTARLLQLATELKAEVDRASKDETSIGAYRKADEIERLAHDLKQRIKN